MTERDRGWKDFSEMPEDVLRALANDIANPLKALKRIRSQRMEYTRAAAETEPTR